MVEYRPIPVAWDRHRGVFIIESSREMEMAFRDKRPGDVRHPRLLRVAGLLMRASRWVERKAFW